MSWGEGRGGRGGPLEGPRRGSTWGLGTGGSQLWKMWPSWETYLTCPWSLPSRVSLSCLSCLTSASPSVSESVQDLCWDHLQQMVVYQRGKPGPGEFPLWHRSAPVVLLGAPLSRYHPLSRTGGTATLPRMSDWPDKCSPLLEPGDRECLYWGYHGASRPAWSGAWDWDCCQTVNQPTVFNPACGPGGLLPYFPTGRPTQYPIPS